MLSHRAGGCGSTPWYTCLSNKSASAILTIAFASRYTSCFLFRSASAISSSGISPHFSAGSKEHDVRSVRIARNLPTDLGKDFSRTLANENNRSCQAEPVPFPSCTSRTWIDSETSSRHTAALQSSMELWALKVVPCATNVGST